jgi:hypothetical protein
MSFVYFVSKELSHSTAVGKAPLCRQAKTDASTRKGVEHSDLKKINIIEELGGSMQISYLCSHQ